MSSSNDNHTSTHCGFMATVGTFDGVHTGHQYLLRQLKECASACSLTPVALVLDPHPLKIVCAERMPALLSDFEMRCQMIRAQGVEPVRLPFTEHTRSETSYEFMKRIHDEMGIKGLLVGHDNSFGSDRGNGITHYIQCGRELGIHVIEAGRLANVSSSTVRRTLSAGDIEGGNRLLGYKYGIEGTVVHGERLGRQIGFPTANITPCDPLRLIPPAGVYATLISTDESDNFKSSMTNIGYRPTVTGGDAPIRIETHIFNFAADLYGQRLRLLFVSRLRDEIRFNSLEELKTQLHTDYTLATQLLAECPTSNPELQNTPQWK